MSDDIRKTDDVRADVKTGDVLARFREDFNKKFGSHVTIDIDADTLKRVQEYDSL